MNQKIPRLTFLECEIKMPVMKLPVRTVVVPVQGGNVLISPGSELSDADYSGIPNITDIVAPSLLHCAGIPHAAKLFPKAKVWGVPGAKKFRPDMPWTHVLSPESWPYQAELPALPIEGMPKVRETVFVHKASRTLIATDLCFHLRHPEGLGAWIFLKLFGTYGRFAVSRLFTQFIKDKSAARKSIEALFQFDFENIAMAHGELVMGGGKEVLAAALKEKKLA